LEISHVEISERFASRGGHKIRSPLYSIGRHEDEVFHTRAQ